MTTPRTPALLSVESGISRPAPRRAVRSWQRLGQDGRAQERSWHPQLDTVDVPLFAVITSGVVLGLLAFALHTLWMYRRVQPAMA